MFCTKCGAEIKDGAKVCPNCGEAVGLEGRISDLANNVVDSAEKEIGSAIKDVKVSIDNGGTYVPGTRLKEDRGLISTVLLSIITCGIYGYYFVYKLAQDVNIACADDGEKTPGLAAYILLSIITCGIYSWYWEYKLGNRLNDNAYNYGFHMQENGTTILLWNIFGALICYIGPFIALNIIIKNTNLICHHYNQKHGY